MSTKKTDKASSKQSLALSMNRSLRMVRFIYMYLIVIFNSPREWVSEEGT